MHKILAVPVGNGVGAAIMGLASVTGGAAVLAVLVLMPETKPDDENTGAETLPTAS